MDGASLSILKPMDFNTLKHSKMAYVIISFFETVWNRIYVLISVILSCLCPIKTFYHIIVFFVIINFIAGVTEDFKRGEKFSFVKFKTFLLRLIFYVLAITIIFLFEKYIIGEFGICSKYLTTFTCGLISLYEIHSFLINAGKITGNPLFGDIYDKLKEFFMKNNDDKKI